MAPLFCGSSLHHMLSEEQQEPYQLPLLSAHYAGPYCKWFTYSFHLNNALRKVLRLNPSKRRGNSVERRSQLLEVTQILSGPVVTKPTENLVPELTLFATPLNSSGDLGQTTDSPLPRLSFVQPLPSPGQLGLRAGTQCSGRDFGATLEKPPCARKTLRAPGLGKSAKNSSKPALNCSQLHSPGARLLVHDSYRLSEREL